MSRQPGALGEARLLGADGRAPLVSRRSADGAHVHIDGEGIDGLSMRKVAQRLGAAPMSLYTYFADKDALLDAVAQLLLAEVETPPEDANWRDAMRFIMRSVREVGMRHRRAAKLINRFPPHTPDSLAFVEAGFRSFRRAGFDALSTARCYRALAAYSLGTLDVELEGYFDPESRTITGDERGGMDAVSAEKVLPLVTEISPLLVQQDDAEEFQYGLELLLDGFADAMKRMGCTV